MKIKAYCHGADCRESVGANEDERQKGWVVVLRYSLNGDGEPDRLILCRVCARRHAALFKAGLVAPHA